MEWLVYLFVVLIAGACGLALYEWRTKRVILKHDLTLDTRAQTEADRESMRAADHATRAHGTMPMGDHSGGA